VTRTPQKPLAETTVEALPTNLVYSVASLARAIEKSPQFVRNAINDGSLSAKRNGKAIFIFPEEAVRWIKDMADA
jgi:hypothetical protein